MEKIRLYALLLLLFFLTKGKILALDTLTLGNVNIVSKISGINTVKLISENQAENASVAEVLSNSGRMYIRNNAPGVLALASVGGLYGHQTALLWNGLNIQSPMNGLFDLNLIPVFFIDQVEFSNVSHSTYSGSGSLGGSINLSSGKPAFNESKIKLVQSAGSFQSYFSGIDALYGNKKSYGRTRIFYQSAVNDFPYIHTQWHTLRTKQVNNKIQNKGFMQETGFILKNKALLEFKLWLQKNERQLPAIFMIKDNAQLQNDDIIRFTGTYKTKLRKTELDLVSAYFRELIVYHDPGVLTARNLSESYMFEINGNHKLSDKHQLDFGLNQTFNLAKVDDYGSTKRQNLSFAALHLHSKYKKYHSTFSFRAQLWDEKLLLPSVSYGANYKISKLFEFMGNVGYSYRIPTLNDLYWIPGGNPDLLPESAFKQQFGIIYKKKETKLQLSAFNNRIQNMIIWLDNGTFWEPDNFRAVWARGIEVEADIQLIKRNQFRLSTQIFSNFIFSTYHEVEAGNESIIGKQLILIPQETLSGKIKADYKKYWIRLSGQGVGVRYTGTDNLDWLDPFYLFDLESGYEFDFSKKHAISLHAGIYNLLHHAYMNMPGRPMPGRNFRLTLKINLNIKKTKI